MDYLWSPWRYRYISKADPASECIFCQKSAETRDKENLIVHRAEHNFILLNLFPYTSGHLMIAPYQHVAFLGSASDVALHEMMLLAKAAERHLGAIYKPHGFNVGMNLGESAGAGIAGHIHLHVVPRWTGDANFMTTVGEARVLPEALETTYEKVAQAFK